MEFCNTNEQDFLQELLGYREMDLYCPNQDFASNYVLDTFSTCDNFDYTVQNCSAPFGDELSPLDLNSDSSNTKVDIQTFPYFQEDYSYPSVPIFEDEDGPGGALFGKFGKVETLPELPVFNMGSNPESERKNKVKKMSGQPSKNLMAERRRRKRLNDRLSMLRSVVPKISKMDRTSILGDSIDYVKELLERVNSLREEMDEETKELSILKDISMANDETLIRNSPKFNVEKRHSDTRIDMCCAAKPGLLLSTVSTLEALGIEIQHCVISCFNDFAMQASCAEELNLERGEIIKQALFRNAGYGGRCL